MGHSAHLGVGLGTYRSGPSQSGILTSALYCGRAGPGQFGRAGHFRGGSGQVKMIHVEATIGGTLQGQAWRMGSESGPKVQERESHELRTK